LKKLIAWLGWMVLASVICLLALTVILSRQGWEFDAVLSGSMEPVLGVGGLVIIRPVDAQDVNVGDVISFKLPDINTPICHRIIEKSQTADGLVFKTKGDANEEADQNPVPAEAVNGKEIFYMPRVGNLARLSQAGRERIYIMGKGLPKAGLVILPLGLAFIGLTLKDALEQIYRPMQKRRKELLKKRRERFKRGFGWK
jgi:signal peptidase I